MRKNEQNILILLSTFALLNVMFVPLFDVWGGLFPREPEYTFFDAIRLAFEEKDWDKWVVQLSFSIFFPSLFMHIAALKGKSILFLISNCSGLLLIFKQMKDYMKQHEDNLKYAFDIEDGNIAIGTWIAIGLFFISFIVVTSTPIKLKKEFNPEKEDIPFTPSTADSMAPKEEKTVSKIKCSSCGYEQPSNRKHCWKCGKPFIFIEEPPTENPTEEALQNRFCIYCGKPIASDKNFCKYCGKEIRK